eukprot:Lankesteria_metandrocarpae@DN3776_c0_g1_i2.p1
MPTLFTTAVEKGNQYTVVMEDPDAPDPDSAEEPAYKHWLQINSPSDNLNGGQERLVYNPPTPPKDSKPHRFYVALYKQPYEARPHDLPAATRFPGKWSLTGYFENTNVKYDEPVAWACFKATSNKSDIVAPERKLPFESVEEVMGFVDQIKAYVNENNITLSDIDLAALETELESMDIDIKTLDTKALSDEEKEQLASRVTTVLQNNPEGETEGAEEKSIKPHK